MSLETWKAEFYPETTVKAAKRGDSAAVEHSLRKWEGLRPANLERHGMVTSEFGPRIFEQKNHLMKFGVAADTCALCQLHYEKECCTCPLAKVRGDVPCDDETKDEVRSPWGEWTHNRNPSPMIHWLTLAKEHCDD